MDQDLSTDKKQVFYNSHNDFLLGTKPTSIKDLHSDWHIATGTKHKNKLFKDSNVHFQKVYSKYNGYEMTITSQLILGAPSQLIDNRKNIEETGK